MAALVVAHTAAAVDFAALRDNVLWWFSLVPAEEGDMKMAVAVVVVVPTVEAPWRVHLFRKRVLGVGIP